MLAINQIKEKNYAVPYKAHGKKIVLIGAGFDELARPIIRLTCIAAKAMSALKRVLDFQYIIH